jgi:hypothetical protein
MGDHPERALANHIDEFSNERRLRTEQNMPSMDSNRTILLLG